MSIATTRKGTDDTATYRVLLDGKPTDYTIVRNDNETEAGGSGLCWWIHRGDEHDDEHEFSTKREALGVRRGHLGRCSHRRLTTSPPTE